MCHIQDNTRYEVYKLVNFTRTISKHDAKLVRSYTRRSVSRHQSAPIHKESIMIITLPDNYSNLDMLDAY